MDIFGMSLQVTLFLYLVYLIQFFLKIDGLIKNFGITVDPTGKQAKLGVQHSGIKVELD